MTSNYYNCLIFGNQGKIVDKNLFSVEEILRRIRKRLMALITNSKNFLEKKVATKNIVDIRALFSSCLMGAHGEERMEGNVQWWAKRIC